jgi:ParB family transcriptional regulator, chromosome partitioning protein
MAEKNKLLIEYYSQIYDIPLSKIEVNNLNPREKFIEPEEDELIESILSKGILNPIIVYKNKDGKHIILDGERRYRACSKLNIKTIPTHVLKREPSTIENISMMFHIHNVREEWTDFAISLSLKRIVEEMGKKINKLNISEIRELKKITSLSEYKLKKYLKFHDYPTEVINIFLESEMKEKPDTGVDPDILSEMHRPLKEIKAQMPEVIEKYPIKRIIKACIEKKADNVITTNKEFRLISQALSASKKGEIRKEVLKDKIIDFIEKKEVSPQDIYSSTSETLYQVKEILKQIEKLHKKIENLDMGKITKMEHQKLRAELIPLIEMVNHKIN